MDFSPPVCGQGIGLSPSPRYRAFSEGVGIVCVCACKPPTYTHWEAEEGHVLDLTCVLAELGVFCVHLVYLGIGMQQARVYTLSDM